MARGPRAKSALATRRLGEHVVLQSVQGLNYGSSLGVCKSPLGIAVSHRSSTQGAASAVSCLVPRGLIGSRVE